MRKLSFASFVALAMLVMPVTLWAQDDRPALSDVWLIMPKQGMQQEFEAAVIQHMAFRTDAGETRNWEAYSVALGSNPLLYQWRTGGLEWADMDAYVIEDQEKGLGENWFANVDQYVDHYHHYIEEADYENSDWPADLGQQPLYGVTTWKWKQGAGPASGKARRELSKIAMDDDWEYNWLWLTRVGGEPQLMLVAPHDSYADMEDPEQTFFDFVTEKLGSEEEAGKLFSEFANGYTSSSYTVWAHRPDLSSPESAGADDD